MVSSYKVFINKCLRRILRIFWPVQISDYDLWTRTNQIKTDFEIWCRKWGWLGNTLRKSPNEIAQLAMDCNPQGSRGQGRPKVAWRRTELEEGKLIGKSLNEIKHSARNGARCKNLTDVLCSEMA
jgi:hypothetical protein